MLMPGMLHAKILWAGTAHAVVRNIDTQDAARVPGVAAGADRRGRTRDQPVRTRRARSAGAGGRQGAVRGRRAGAGGGRGRGGSRGGGVEDQGGTSSRCGPFSPTRTPWTPDAPSVHEGGNVFQHTTVRKGDLEKGIGESDVIVENSYHTHRMDHVPMEPEAGLAYLDPFGSVEHYGGDPVSLSGPPADRAGPGPGHEQGAGDPRRPSAAASAARTTSPLRSTWVCWR